MPGDVALLHREDPVADPPGRVAPGDLLRHLRERETDLSEAGETGRRDREAIHGKAPVYRSEAVDSEQTALPMCMTQQGARSTACQLVPVRNGDPPYRLTSSRLKPAVQGRHPRTGVAC